MRITWRRVALLLPGLILACSGGSSRSNAGTTSSASTTGGGCGGGGGGGGSWGSSVKDAPKDDGPRANSPSDPAPTGQQWKPVETDEGCGRMGLRWVLVDEVCGDGEGNDDAEALHAPMFRDGAIVDGHLFAVDATHLWSIDLKDPSATALSRASILTGLGTPISVDKRGTSELVLASGSDGLVMVDATDANAPKRTRSITLAGKAFDVRVAGDKAFVAMGSAGIAEVDLATATPSITHSWPIGGFSAGITTRDGFAYVAACSTFKIVDLSNGQTVSETWVPNAIQKGRLVAPAKNVTLAGDVAFVAAGRYGAVSIDVKNPKQPKVIGNCTVHDDPAFYASGVRTNASGDKLFVAGGEWGILPVDTTNPSNACTTIKAQQIPDDPDVSCSAKPPWEIVPWEKIWAPPPPGKDPIQTLSEGDRLYAFGDARRIGVRAVDVRDALTTGLPFLARYDEPRLLLGVTADATRVIAVGPAGGIWSIGPSASAQLTRTSNAEIDEKLRGATSVTLLSDGRWAAATDQGIFVEGKAQVISMSDASSLSAAGGSKIAVTGKSGVHLIDVDSGTHSVHGPIHPAHLPISVTADANGSIFYAAPEWPSATRLQDNLAEDVDAHTVFDAEDIMDASLWKLRLPRRHLLATARGLVEVAGVGPAVGLVVHGKNNITKKVSVPTMTYAAAATDGDHVYLAGIDRGLYKSYLVSVDISKADPKVLSVEAFTGAVSGVTATNGFVFVADADGALRKYAIDSNGAATLASSTSVEVSP